jgi:hypothetical protein
LDRWRGIAVVAPSAKVEQPWGAEAGHAICRASAMRIDGYLPCAAGVVVRRYLPDIGGGRDIQESESGPSDTFSRIARTRDCIEYHGLRGATPPMSRSRHLRCPHRDN